MRIGPNEIHVADPDCYDAIFNFSPEIDKRSTAGGRRPAGGMFLNTHDALECSLTVCQGGLFGQAAVDDSKLHRRPYNPPFSRPAVIKKEELVRDKIATIISALDNACGTDQVIDISSYYRALTTDIIASFAFGKDMDLLHNLEKAERLYAVWRALWRRMARYEPLRYKVLPWVEWFVSLLPSRRSSQSDPDSIKGFMEYQEVGDRLYGMVGSAHCLILGDENLYRRHTEHRQRTT